MFKRFSPILLLDSGSAAGGQQSSGQPGEQDWQKMYTELKTLVESADHVNTIIAAAIQRGEVYEAKRFTGLSSTLNNVTGERDTVKAALAEKDTLLANVTTELAAVKEQLTALSSEKDEFTARAAKAEGELDVTKKRTSLLHEKFPALIKFEAAGLLPVDANMEALEQKLIAFQKALGETSKDAITNFQSGGTTPPPPPSDNTAMKSADFLALANKNFGVDMQKYQEYYQKYLDALSKEGKSNS